MRRRREQRDKKKSLLLVWLYISLGLFFCWLLLLIFWLSSFPGSPDTEKDWKQSVHKFADVIGGTKNNRVPSDGEADGNPSPGKKGSMQAEKADGHGVLPTMDEVLAEHPFDEESFAARFEQLKEPKRPRETLLHSTSGKKVAYVYHSHNRESFLPYFPETDNPQQAYDATRNITAVGQMLERALENQGIGTLADSSDLMAELDLRGLGFPDSYQVSREHLLTARATYKQLSLFLDIHRDSLRKGATTKDMNGLPYAQLFFVVGISHPAYAENLAFAEKVSRRLDAKYPGLSKGVYPKDSSQGNGVYNQDLSPTAMLVEMGGVDSTLEELQRTSEALAEVLSEIYWHEPQ